MSSWSLNLRPLDLQSDRLNKYEQSVIVTLNTETDTEA